MMVLCLCFSFGVYIMGVLLVIPSKYCVIYGLGGCRGLVNVLKSQGWFGTVSDPSLWYYLLLHSNLMTLQTSLDSLYLVGYIFHNILSVLCSLQGLQVKWMRAWMECSLTDFLAWGPGWLTCYMSHLHLPGSGFCLLWISNLVDYQYLQGMLVFVH